MSMFKVGDCVRIKDDGKSQDVLPWRGAVGWVYKIRDIAPRHGSIVNWYKCRFVVNLADEEFRETELEIVT